MGKEAQNLIIIISNESADAEEFQEFFRRAGFDGTTIIMVHTIEQIMGIVTIILEINQNIIQFQGLTKNASQEDIKKAYRTKAREYHPDKMQWKT